MPFYQMGYSQTYLDAEIYIDFTTILATGCLWCLTQTLMKELLPPIAKNIVGRATFFSLQMVNHRVGQITVVLMRKYVTTPIDYPMDGSTFLSVQAENTTGENIKVQLTSCLTGLDLTKQNKTIIHSS